MRDLNGKNHPHIKRDLGCRVALLPRLSDHTLFVRVTPQGRGERTRAVPSARMSQMPSTPLPSYFIDYQVALLRPLASLSLIFETRFLRKGGKATAQSRTFIHFGRKQTTTRAHASSIPRSLFHIRNGSRCVSLRGTGSLEYFHDLLTPPSGCLICRCGWCVRASALFAVFVVQEAAYRLLVCCAREGEPLGSLQVCCESQRAEGGGRRAEDQTDTNAYTRRVRTLACLARGTVTHFERATRLWAAAGSTTRPPDGSVFTMHCMVFSRVRFKAGRLPAYQGHTLFFPAAQPAVAGLCSCCTSGQFPVKSHDRRGCALLRAVAKGVWC